MDYIARKAAGSVSLTQGLKNYLDLAKLRLVSMVMLSMAVGYCVAARGEFAHHAPHFFWAMLGTFLSAAGSMALNQWMEIDRDAKMKRTFQRPLPSGRLLPAQAFTFGMLTAVSGILILFLEVNPIAALLSALTLISYLFFYTLAKPVTTLSTLIGAIPGAIPPLIGWAAARGTISLQAWSLFAILFFWQMPHFLAISWMYRHEFAAADFHMLAVVDKKGDRVARQMIFYTSVLLPVSLLPTVLGLAGNIYLAGAVILGLVFIWNAIQCLKNIDLKARTLFRTSLVYLSIILFLLVLDKL